VATNCKNNGANSFSAFSTVKQLSTVASYSVSSRITEAVTESKTSSVTVYPNPANETAIAQVNSSKVNEYNAVNLVCH
jgi:hypothetical protein